MLHGTLNCGALHRLPKRWWRSALVTCTALLLISATALVIHLPCISQMWQDRQVLRARLKLQILQDEADIVPQLRISQLLSLATKIPSIRGSGIPKIIHQSYKTTTLPADFKAY
jgi:hypothetical protein